MGAAALASAAQEERVARNRELHDHLEGAPASSSTSASDSALRSRRNSVPGPGGSATPSSRTSPSRRIRPTAAHLHQCERVRAAFIGDVGRGGAEREGPRGRRPPGGRIDDEQLAVAVAPTRHRLTGDLGTVEVLDLERRVERRGGAGRCRRRVRTARRPRRPACCAARRAG